MQLTRTTKPQQLPFDIEYVKKHIRVDQDLEDDLVAGYIASAIDECSRYMQVAIAQQGYRMSFDCWPGVIWLPMSPIVSVDSVKYRDTVGDEKTISSDDWDAYKQLTGAAVIFAPDFVYPTLYDRPDSLFVDFVAGFDAEDGSSGDTDPELEMPPGITQAVCMTVANYYANRESVAAGNKVPLPRGAEHLMDFHRVYR